MQEKVVLSKVFAIDFGTTETVLFCYVNGKAEVVRQYDGGELLPSVVSFQNGSPVVGNAAKETENPAYIQLKRIRGRQ